MSEYKASLLGMPFGTASHRLRKAILFRLLQRLGEDLCFRCGEQIASVEVLSVEHKEAWQSALDPSAAFFDLSNISFSHLSCNIGSAFKPNKRFDSPLDRKHAAIARRKDDPTRYARHLEEKRLAKRWQKS